MKKFGFIFSFAFFAILLSGCNGQNSPVTKQARDAVKTALQAREIGKNFEAGTRAAQNHNLEDLARKCAELRRLGASREADLLSLGAAELAVVEANNYEMVARISSTRKLEVTALATQNYRLALRLSPDFPSQNAELLNALGYFMADRGVSASDFSTAEALTRRAVQKYDEVVKAQSDPLARPDIALARANTRDSLAWSLFRQRKFEAARREQQQALNEARVALKGSSIDTNGEAMKEMNSHWQQIEKALGRNIEPMVAPTPVPPPPPPPPENRAATPPLRAT